MLVLPRPPGPRGIPTIEAAPSEQAFEAAGARGWTWPHGTPGFRFGHDERRWNFMQLSRAELVGAGFPIDASGRSEADGIRVLGGLRARPQDVLAFVARSDAAGRTCIAAILPLESPRFDCRLDRQVALVLVDPLRWPEPRGRTAYPLYLLGLARGDVTRIEVTAPGFRQTLLREAWGTFELAYGPTYGPSGPTPSSRTLAPVAPRAPWRARLDFYGRQGPIARLDLRLDRPVERLVTVER